jgi:hypothetical protein
MRYLIWPGIGNRRQVCPGILTNPGKSILTGGKDIGIIYKGIPVNVRRSPATPVITTCWQRKAENISGAGGNVSMYLVIYKVVMINFVIITVIVEINSVVVVRESIFYQDVVVAIVVEVNPGVVTRGGIAYQGITAGIVKINSMALVPAGGVACQDVVA